MNWKSLKQRVRAFTLVEILVVMSIIAALAGLVMASASYVQKKAAKSRAAVEIQALSGGCESYKADFGSYPRDDKTTDALNAKTSLKASGYTGSSLFLYKELAGDKDADGVADTSANGRLTVYFQFGPNMLGRPDMSKPPVKGTNVVQYIRDPFGASYGYSTIGLKNSGTGTAGYNPTYDLWSTGGDLNGTASGTSGWITNWE